MQRCVCKLLVSKRQSQSANRVYALNDNYALMCGLAEQPIRMRSKSLVLVRRLN